MPLMRFGKMHFLNNYIYECPDGDGFNTRINSIACIERNYFDNVKKPVFGKPSESGAANLIDNKFVDCSRLPAAYMSSNSPDADALSESEELIYIDWTPPYTYTNFVDSVDSVPTIVNKWVGVNKLSIDDTTSQGGTQTDPEVNDTSDTNTTDTTDQNSVIIAETINEDFIVYTRDNNLIVNAKAGNTLHVYALTGRLIYSSFVTDDEEVIPLNQKGLFIVRVGTSVKKIMLY